KFKSKAMEPYDVDLEVLSCGICHSDIHLNEGDWGAFSEFPQVSGHEIVGKVIDKGPLASLEVGDVVGVGWQAASCHACEYCTTGQENLCQDAAKVRYTCAGGSKGGFADYWRGDARFCFKAPPGLDPRTIGPLMCGGGTMYNPLVTHTKPGMHVGILGVGGLGHLGVKLAKARGNSVLAISRLEAKRAEVLAMGADQFVASDDEAQLAAAKNSVDVLIVTVPAAPPSWTPYFDLLKPNGKMVFVGAVPEPVPVQIWPWVCLKQLSVVGSIIAAPHDLNALLQFAGKHPEVAPAIEVMKFKDINKAIARVKAADVRFRMVLEH
ncbi:chaperonin 10-like protein, partial [Pelagophyceae sp. CCMP2097]